MAQPGLAEAQLEERGEEFQNVLGIGMSCRLEEGYPNVSFRGGTNLGWGLKPQA